MDIRSVTFHRAAYQPGDFPQDRRPQFAMVGRSNVGKSSLINAVLNRKGVARVSQTPGKTQAVQFYLVNEKFYLVDLPGYGYAKVPKSVVATWGTLVRGYLESAQDLRVMFLLLDVRRTPGEHDLQMHQWARALSDVDERIVLTKSDKLSNNQLAAGRRAIAQELEIDESALIPASSVTKKGIDQIRREIFSRL
ncbi:MAG TPA: ribosome biogenesis GTP-binding protein YihA/YsxC [Thermoanaerobaculia bacterium]